MEWETRFHSDSRYIEVISRGIADKDGSLRMAAELAKAMRKNRLTKVLIDHRHIDGVSGEIIEIYERPKLFLCIGVILRIKIAEIINPRHAEHFRFLETVCRNRGYRFSIFFENPPALAWLLE